MVIFKKFVALILIAFSGMLFSASTPEGIQYTHFFLKDKTSVHLLKIDPKFYQLIASKANDGSLATVETLAIREKAVAAINGGFFHTRGKLLGQPSGILKIEENWYGLPSKPRGAIGWSTISHQMLFDQLLTEKTDHNEIAIITKSTYPKDWDSMTYIVGGTPLLIQNGQLIENYASEKTIQSFLDKKHARTAIGVLPNGHFVFVVVDGTDHFFFKNSGIDMLGLGQLMRDIDCMQALNLDGGGSSTLVLDGEVINTPCGEYLDRRGNKVRKVSDAILVIPIFKDSASCPPIGK